MMESNTYWNWTLQGLRGAINIVEMCVREGALPTDERLTEFRDEALRLEHLVDRMEDME